MYLGNFVKFFAAIGVIAAFCTTANAVNDPVAVWTMEPEPFLDAAGANMTTGPSVPASTGTGNLFGVHANAATDWTTPAGSAGSANAYSANTWEVGDYFQFQTSTLGLTDIGLKFDVMGSSTGPRDFQVAYSTDGSSFTDFGSPYAVTNAFETQQVDLTSITGLDNQANVYFRLRNTTTVRVVGPDPVAAGGTSRVDNVSVLSNFQFIAPPTPRLPEPGDVVFGLNLNSAAGTFELVSGPDSASGGAASPDPWTAGPSFIQSVEFDNAGGQLHNARGNLLGLDFGGTASGGTGLIYSFGANGSIPAPAGQLIGNTLPAPNNIGQSGGLTLTRLTSVSVSPDNTKIAAAGYDSGSVLVYDYTAGDTTGSGASLANGRQTAATLATGSTQGTTWMDNDTVLTFSAAGDIYEVDANTMSVSPILETLPVPNVGPAFTSLYYNPDISNFVYASYNSFLNNPDPTPDLATNVVYVLDPADGYSVEQEIELTSLSTSIDSIREIALDEDGNLYIGTFGSDIHFIPAAALAAGTDDSSIFWYDSVNSSSFNGLDIGHGEAAADGDYNNDGTVDAADYVAWRKTPGNFGGDPAGYNVWKQTFGQPSPGAGGGGAVPEPASISLLLVGVAALALRRRTA